MLWAKVRSRTRFSFRQKSGGNFYFFHTVNKSHEKAKKTTTKQKSVGKNTAQKFTVYFGLSNVCYKLQSESTVLFDSVISCSCSCFKVFLCLYLTPNNREVQWWKKYKDPLNKYK